MKKKITLATAIVLMLFAAILTFQVTFHLVSGQYQSKVDALVKTQSDFSKLAQADALIRQYFSGDLDDEAVENGLIRGYLESLDDKYSYYMTADEYRRYQKSQNQSVAGIGVRLTFDAAKNEIVVYSVVKDSPADEAGIRKGDVIYRIGEVFAADLGFYETVEFLSGDEGTTVDLVVQREVATRVLEMNLSMTRRTVTVPEVTYEMLEQGVGYISIHSFRGAAFDEFSAALNAMVLSDATGIIFDVRNNTGGDFDTVIRFLDRLLPQCVSARTFDKNGNETKIWSDSDCVHFEYAVLVNGNTASEAELFAASLRDNDLAMLVGDSTYGKGVTQSIIQMDDGSALFLSTSSFSPPVSDSFDGVGIVPDIEVPLGADNLYLLSHEEDKQLQEVIPFLCEN